MDALADTIVAISTPAGSGAIGVVRLTGPKAIAIADRIFYGKNLLKASGHSVHYGKLKTDEGKILDECVVTVFKAPRSYTREDVVEFSCHGSSYILETLIKLIINNGARTAQAGEFTQRAFLNGQLDLSQAEAVADLIAADTQSQHQVAMHQLRGGVSDRIKNIRTRLIKFASLIELENDFGEEDVTFADTQALELLVREIQTYISQLMQSFEYGNAIKKGVPVAIIGEPNVGKSTLLNALLQEDKAIVSHIPGTTRDVIEDAIQLSGILFRFIDTAGLRTTDDEIENLGIQRTRLQIDKARIVLFVAALSDDYLSIIRKYKELHLTMGQKVFIILNKSDLYDHPCHQYDIQEAISTITKNPNVLLLSAKNGDGIEALTSSLVNQIKSNEAADQSVITNLRHFEALDKTQQSLSKVLHNIQNKLPSDLIALDIRQAMRSLGVISGEIYTDDLLDVIFRDFCIGK